MHVLPAAEHRWCARHIQANWSKKWSSGELKKLFWIELNFLKKLILTNWPNLPCWWDNWLKRLKSRLIDHRVQVQGQIATLAKNPINLPKQGYLNTFPYNRNK